MEISFLNVFLLLSFLYVFFMPPEEKKPKANLANNNEDLKTKDVPNANKDDFDIGNHSIEKLDTLDYLRGYVRENHSDMYSNFNNVFSKVIPYYSNILISSSKDAEVIYVTDNNSLIIRADVAFHALSRNLVIHPLEKEMVS